MHDVFIFQEGSSKLAGSPNLMVGKPSTPTSSPNSTHQSPDMSQIFPESTLRPPTHGFSITNAVLPVLYCGKHLWHVATCFDQETPTCYSYITYVTYVIRMYVFLQILHLSSPHPALHITHEDGGMTVVLLHQLIPCRLHGLKGLVPWCWYVSSKQNCEEKGGIQVDSMQLLLRFNAKKMRSKVQSSAEYVWNKKLRGLSTF